jgi:hypothetical protein
VNLDENFAEAPSPEIPELQVLHRYAGEWEDEIVGKPGVKRTEAGEWILDGRFLRQTWTTDASEGSPKASGWTLMTYDVEKHVYRSWSFLATGSVIENEGVWDDATQTLTWGHRLPGTEETVITKASFVDEATQTWSIVKTDAHGKVVREVVGRSNRRSYPALSAA